jgi:AcrR family transcriptional regulator
VNQREETRRGSYHHGNLPAALAAAAARLARDGGPEAVVLREAARQVGVSATAAYRHFANHDDLLHAVKEQAMAGLAARMEAEMAATPDLADPVANALRKMRASGMGYLRYAIAEPGLFRTAFCRTDKPGADAAEPAMLDGPDPSTSRPFQLMTQILDTLAEHGQIGPGRRPFAEFAAWSAVHGLAVLLIDGPLARMPEPVREAAIARTIDMAVTGVCQAD